MEEEIKKEEEITAEELDSPFGELTIRQKRFCELYASKTDLFGNGTRAYIEAYNLNPSGKEIKDYKVGMYSSAGMCASRLLGNAKICAYINSLLEADGFNDVTVDKQLKFLIDQHEDRASKVAAIKEYNKLKQRIVDRQKVEHDISQETRDIAKEAISKFLNGHSKDTGV